MRNKYDWARCGSQGRAHAGELDQKFLGVSKNVTLGCKRLSAVDGRVVAPSEYPRVRA